MAREPLVFQVKKSGAAKKPYKAMSSLVAQWQRAKSEIDQEDRMLAESDEEEKPEPTAFKIAKWKQDQILRWVRTVGCSGSRCV